MLSKGFLSPLFKNTFFYFRYQVLKFCAVRRLFQKRLAGFEKLSVICTNKNKQ